MRPLILFSGGMDSALCAEMSLREGHHPLLVCFNYGQSNLVEIIHARALAASMGLNLHEHRLPEMKKPNGVVYEGRNLALISAAIPVACHHNCDEIIIGCNKSDYDDFPDCRPEFVDSLNQVVSVAEYPVQVRAPLIDKTKSEVVEFCRRLDVDISKTWSCYTPDRGNECGSCLACRVKSGAMR